MFKAKKFYLSLFFLFSNIVNCLAQEGPVWNGYSIPGAAHGFDYKGVFQGDSLDQVNVSNGMVTINIPIGISYPITPDFSYQLGLTYSSQPWSFQQDVCGWQDHGGQDPGTNVEYYMPLPNELHNAGFGWSLNLGRLLEPNDDNQFNYNSTSRPQNWTFVDPSGARHEFLPANLAYDVLSESTKLVSTNGSLLKLSDRPHNECSDSGSSSSCKIIEFPDGKTYEFKNVTQFSHFTNVYGAQQKDYRVTRISDAAGNFLNIEYYPNKWILSDIHGRSHTVTFLDSGYQLIDNISLAAINGKNATPTNAVYDFLYREVNLPLRHKYENWGSPLEIQDCFKLDHGIWQWGTTSTSGGNHITHREQQVNLLEEIIQPDGTTYKFEYHEEADDYKNVQNEGVVAGVMTSYEDIKGKRTEFVYQSYAFADFNSWLLTTPFQVDDGVYIPTRPGKSFLNPLIGSPGVKFKKVYKANSSTNEPYQVWKYEINEVFVNDLLAHGLHHCARKTRVTNPKGYYTDYYFNTWDELRFTDTDPGLAGMNMSRCELINDDDHYAVWLNEGPYVARKYFDDNGTHRKTESVEYVKISHDDYFYSGHRLQGISKVEYFDESGALENYSINSNCINADTNNCPHDGLGNFSISYTDGDYSDQDYRFTQSEYSPIPSDSERWVVGNVTFSTTGIDENSDTFHTKYCYENPVFPTKWTGKRTYANTSFLPTESTSDLLTLQEFTNILPSDDDPNAYVRVLSKNYGGDIQHLPAENSYSGCGSNLNQIPQYASQIQYKYGSSHIEEILNPQDLSVFIEKSKNTVNKETGAITQSEDASGVITEYRFDEMGRLIRVQSGNDAAIQLSYAFPTQEIHQGNKNSWLNMKICDSDISGPVCTPNSDNFLFQHLQYFDSLGRSVKKQNSIPRDNGSLGSSHINYYYDVLGRVTSNSEWSFGSSSLFYNYSEYDFFSRPKFNRLPNGNTVDFVYFNQNEKLTKSLVQTGDNQQKISKTWVFNNLHGQIVKVKRLVEGDNSFTFRSNKYNAQGKLVQSCNNDSNNSAIDSCTGEGEQKRVNVYDGRGFLIQETLPELAGSSRHYQYDAGGNLVYEAYSNSSQGAKKMKYDYAGRLIRVLNDVTLKPIVEYSFANEDNGSLSQVKNKQIQTKRHNYVDIGNDGQVEDIIVTKTTGYDLTRNKRPVWSTVRSNLDSAPVFKLTGMEYDILGNLKKFDQPRCRNVSCSVVPSQPVRYNYVAGLVKSMPGLISNINYQSDGSISEIYHSSGFVEKIKKYHHGNDSIASFWEPLSLIELNQLSTGQNVWQHGPIKWDSAGNIKSIGSDVFSYDLLSRMTKADITIDRNGNEQNITQIATHDLHDNLIYLSNTGLELGDDPGPGPIPVDPSTNRLTGFNAQYDNRGNTLSLEVLGDEWSFEYDDLNNLVSQSLNGEKIRSHLYDGSNKRFATFDHVEMNWEWSIRGSANKPISIFQSRSDFDLDNLLTHKDDYFYLGSKHIASTKYVNESSVNKHYHYDHLGTPRVISQNQEVVKRIDLLPYGSYINRPEENQEKMVFTGHERDHGIYAESDLDYMQERYYLPHIGRFLQVDPARDGWSLYGYVSGNPLNSTDPSGMERITIATPSSNTLNKWTDEQRTQENMKNIQTYIEARRGNLVTLGPDEQMIPRSSSTKPNYIKAGGQVGPNEHVDHRTERVFQGASNDPNALQSLDASVNTSNGVRVKNATADLAPGTKVTDVEFTLLGPADDSPLGTTTANAKNGSLTSKASKILDTPLVKGVSKAMPLVGLGQAYQDYQSGDIDNAVLGVLSEAPVAGYLADGAMVVNDYIKSDAFVDRLSNSKILDWF